jgi:hypothetical protein
MKKVILRLVLIPLCAIELWITAGFLPERWQEAIWSAFPHMRDQWDITHPALGHEIDQVLGNYFWVVYAILAVLLMANTSLMVWIWKGARTKRNHNGTDS